MFSFLKILFSILSIGSALLLILVIMMQQSKSHGGIGAVSGGAAESMFGTSATSVLTKTTTWLAVIFLLSTLALGMVLGHHGLNSKSVVENEAPAAAVAAPAEAAPAEAAPAEAAPAEAAK